MARRGLGQYLAGHRRLDPAVLALAWCLLVSAHADLYLRMGAAGIARYSNLADTPGYTLVVAPVRDEGGRDQAGPRPVPASVSRYAAQVGAAATEFNVEEALLHAVITAESGYNPGAVSRAGAQGLMQLTPDTARRYGVADAFDAGQNIRGGTRYLRDLLDLFDNDVELAVAAYNAGENAVLRHGRKIPPYRETQAYVAKVQAYYRTFQGTL